MDNSKMGIFLAKLRKEKGKTQDECALEFNVDRGTISKWERGVNSPTPDMLLTLSKYYRVSVNEILLGERLNDENKDELDNLSVNILKINKKKITKLTLFSIFIIIVLTFLLLVYYFFVNYNSIKVYKIDGDGINFFLSDGLMIVSNEKTYIKIGEIRNTFNDENIDSVRLYYKKDDKEYEIYNDFDITNLLVNHRLKDELFNSNDLNILINELYLDVIYGNSIETIKLILRKDFTNNLLVFNQSKTEDDIDNKSLNRKSNNDSIPELIKNNFNLDKNEEYYYLESYNNGIKIKQEYFIDNKRFCVTVGDGKWEYFIDSGMIYFRHDTCVGSNIYSLNAKTFIVKECFVEYADIDYFINNYGKYFDL